MDENFSYLKKISAYWELTRPITHLGIITLILSISVIASKGLPPIIPLLISLLSLLCLNAASNSINQFCDIKTDEISKPFRPIPRGDISLKNSLIFSIGLYITSLVLGIFINLQFYILLIIFAIISILYSVPPFRIKRKWYLSNFSIAISRGLLLTLLGWSIVTSIWNPLPWYLGLIFTLYHFGAGTIEDFQDVEGDKKENVITIPIKYGTKKAIKIISPFLYLPFVILIPFGIWLGIIPPLGIILILLGFWGYSISKILNKNLMYLHMHHKNTSSTCHTYIRPVYWLTLLSPIFFAAVYIVSTVL